MPKKKTVQPDSIGEKIRKARQKKKISLDRVANDTGCSIDFLKELEAGKTIPPVGTLLQISKAQEIINKTLTPEYLQHEAIQAQMKMANSPNHTTVYIPSGDNGIPVVRTIGSR